MTKGGGEGVSEAAAAAPISGSGYRLWGKFNLHFVGNVLHGDFILGHGFYQFYIHFYPRHPLALKCHLIPWKK